MNLMTDLNSDVLTVKEGLAGRLRLNRPKALHSLNRQMVRDMAAALHEWRDDPEVRIILIDHAEGRGFCAGGDVVGISQDVEGHDAAARAFFFDEYRLNHLEYTYPKPGIAFMDGVTMGGGVGIACPCRYRIATENTVLAMPETAIGIFPDVGGGRYLSRLRGRLAQFLALTGARLDGAECLWTGLATHYLPASAIPEAKQRIAAGHEIGGVLTSLSVKPPEARIEGQAALIRKHFASDTLEDILASLEADDGEWAAKELATLRLKSPQACKVALRQLAASAKLTDFADNMAMEYRIGAHVLVLPDFAEGVRAVIVDKDHAPKWNPPTPEGVTPDRLDAIFASLPANEEWKPL